MEGGGGGGTRRRKEIQSESTGDKEDVEEKDF